MRPVTCYKGQQHLNMSQPLRNKIKKLNPDHNQMNTFMFSILKELLSTAQFHRMYTMQPIFVLRVPAREGRRRGGKEVCLISLVFVSNAGSVLRGEI